ncbi:MAG: hypothetical protein JXA13_10810 [Anaerolineales bacterium]|nr:hypothetical protein [Anaerolineales bacterium]
MDHQDIHQVRRFYELLEQIEIKIGGKRTLADCDGYLPWPERGVYFFFEPGEERSTSGCGLRCVRVGTHALARGSQSTLWKRLRQHRGKVGGHNPEGGNHRGSVFREHVGTALIQRDHWPDEIAGNWGGSNAPREIKQAEAPLEREISRLIGRMPFLWLEVNDEPGPNSLRGTIERSSIALLSNYFRKSNPIDPPSKTWLGQWAKSEKVRRSGMWNSNHVDERFDVQFLATLENLL